MSLHTQFYTFFSIFTLVPMVGCPRPNPLHTVSSTDATSIVIKYIIRCHVRSYIVNTLEKNVEVVVA